MDQWITNNQKPTNFIEELNEIHFEAKGLLLEKEDILKQKGKSKGRQN